MEGGQNDYNLKLKKNTFPPFSETYFGSRVFVQKHNFSEKRNNFMCHAFFEQCCVFHVSSCVLSLCCDRSCVIKKDFLNISGNHEISEKKTQIESSL